MLLRRRFWSEVTAFFASLVLFSLTLVWRDWIEVVFGFDPDAHSGTTEWLVVVVCAVVTVTSLVLARCEWRRAARATL